MTIHLTLCDTNIDTTLNTLESDGNTIFNWFAENLLKANANKSHFIITKKLLGINIDHELKFENHVKHLCKESNQKLLALSRIAPFVNTE